MHCLLYGVDDTCMAKIHTPQEKYNIKAWDHYTEILYIYIYIVRYNQSAY